MEQIKNSHLLNKILRVLWNSKVNNPGEILGSHGGEYEDESLLGYSTV
jgi:hypothetical protein